MLNGLASASALILPAQFGACAPAAPTRTALHLTPPLAAAKTIQVTEVVFGAGSGSARPSLDISDGKTLTGFDGKQARSQPTARAEWPFPLVGLLNNTPGPVTAVPAVREGRTVLVAVRSLSAAGRTEYWFDPQTHLLLRELMFIAWQGQMREVERTDYVHWVLNKPLPPSVFRWNGAAGEKRK